MAIADSNIWMELVVEAGRGLSRKRIDPSDCLIGPGATIDSLDLLNFLVRLEALATARLGVFVPIVEKDSLSHILRDAHKISDLIAILEKIPALR